MTPSQTYSFSGNESAATTSVYASPERGDENPQTPVVDYPQLPLPSSVSSIHSGHQPQSDHGVVESMDAANDATASGSNPSTHDGSYKGQDPPSSSPLPSLDELWRASQAPKLIQSPPKSSQVSAQDRSQKVTDRFGRIPGRVLDMAAPDSPSPRRCRKSQGQPRQRLRQSFSFQAPEGADIVTLSSSPSSSSNNHAEKHADDRGSSLPHSSGWVKMPQGGAS